MKCSASGKTKEKEQTPTSPTYNFSFTWDGANLNKDAVSREAQMPETIVLVGNYPNPFNPTTTVRYALPEEAHVHLAVYNSIGELVSELKDATLPAGVHEVTWDAGDAPSGTYYVRMISGETHLQHSMQLVK